MRFLKNSLLVVFFIVSGIACSTLTPKNSVVAKEEPVVIANDSLEYEITIIDPGFTTYLNSIARPRGYHSLAYLEIRNRFYVPIWNTRVNNPGLYNPAIYENSIDYDPHVNYGYEVNYILFNYFEFAQSKYRMVLR